MAKRKVIWFPRARMTLKLILDYYTLKNRNKIYSAKLFQKFNKELSILKDQPEIGKKTEFPNIRSLVIGNYILLYELTSEVITVHSKRDSRQDPDAHSF